MTKNGGQTEKKPGTMTKNGGQTEKKPGTMTKNGGHTEKKPGTMTKNGGQNEKTKSSDQVDSLWAKLRTRSSRPGTSATPTWPWVNPSERDPIQALKRLLKWEVHRKPNQKKGYQNRFDHHSHMFMRVLHCFAAFLYSSS